jgi:hypothetical protein
MPQNFQNWMSLDKLSDPSSPSGIRGTEFQDWSNLVGPSDFLKKPAGVANTSATPVAPPQNWADLAQQAIAPVQQKFNNFSDAASQLGQGNTFNAYQAYKGRALPTANPIQTETMPPVEQEPSGFNFSRH